MWAQNITRGLQAKKAAQGGKSRRENAGSAVKNWFSGNLEGMEDPPCEAQCQFRVHEGQQEACATTSASSRGSATTTGNLPLIREATR